RRRFPGISAAARATSRSSNRSRKPRAACARVRRASATESRGKTRKERRTENDPVSSYCPASRLLRVLPCASVVALDLQGTMKTKPRFDVIGKPRRRVDGRAKVTGLTRFADDVMLPRTVHCKLLRSPHPHAVIERIDTTRAQAHPGVHLVLTGRDF